MWPRRTTSSASERPVEIRVPALNDEVHGLRGGWGCNPGVVGREIRKKRSKPELRDRSPGARLVGRVREEDQSGVAPVATQPLQGRRDPCVGLPRDARRDVDDNDPVRPLRKQRLRRRGAAGRDEDYGEGKHRREHDEREARPATAAHRGRKGPEVADLDHVHEAFPSVVSTRSASAVTSGGCGSGSDQATRISSTTTTSLPRVSAARAT